MKPFPIHSETEKAGSVICPPRVNHSWAIVREGWDERTGKGKSGIVEY
jgi:hypothetical protein